MEEHKLIERLTKETNISYEDAKIALEISNWDVLDAVICLEEKGKIQRPSSSIFYTNENKGNYNRNEITNIQQQENKQNWKKREHNFEGFFVKVCKLIDTCNNIFLEIRKENKTFLRIPITVILVLVVFAFWIFIPLYILGLFFDIDFSLSGQRIEINKINQVLKAISLNVKRLKDKFKKGY
ncbi:hypothetical protein B0P06_005005 [Clostridium saccharoperbutylacetonicum]|uniref:Uncharacterized protein n=1 Tax=Clostridium saccharoperbutylacetonicum N1-4(HMT) TaxID=931276 RepID=M1MZA5_9CLOT|nr:DUF4342 domain-containing protein [Clostridium saccharoperbutylacetonicum]AGF56717.1 hypothetical protein Cspa_c29560 [Clostridium saccharoperbutylacetonicum N1-4(HMT)]NRT62528.1 hypothetical protein [Clostridium saccharoperbutylacetonicum]NSB45234.1 hypothetical protein [Clostridium saccharoperbutylacetonicum]